MSGIRTHMNFGGYFLENTRNLQAKLHIQTEYKTARMYTMVLYRNTQQDSLDIVYIDVSLFQFFLITLQMFYTIAQCFCAIQLFFLF